MSWCSRQKFLGRRNLNICCYLGEICNFQCPNGLLIKEYVTLLSARIRHPTVGLILRGIEPVEQLHAETW